LDAAEVSYIGNTGCPRNQPAIAFRLKASLD